jgi:hypothetical protein
VLSHQLRLSFHSRFQAHFLDVIHEGLDHFVMYGICLLPKRL